jgi:hypothetical protein
MTGPRLRTASLPASTQLAARSKQTVPQDGSHVHQIIDWSGRRPALLRQHRHDYAAGLHRGLPTAGTRRLRSRTHSGVRALHTGPYPPDWSRLRGYGASSTGSLTLHLLTSLDEPAPSGSTDTARLLGAACHQSPSFPAIGCPDASSGRCDGPTETVSHHLSIHLAPRGAQLAAKKADAVFKIALRNSAFSRLKRFNSADSSVVVPGCAPASTWVWRTHLRTVSAQPTPSSRATSLIAAHSDSC